jgi:hypothetical protein
MTGPRRPAPNRAGASAPRVPCVYDAIFDGRFSVLAGLLRAVCGVPLVANPTAIPST